MKLILSTLKIIVCFLASLCKYCWGEKIKYVIFVLKREFITSLYKDGFKSFGHDSLLGIDLLLLNTKYISIGNGSSIGARSTLTCYDTKTSDQMKTLEPSINIGDGVSVGEDAHITCINKIIIGNNVLMGKKVLITDNSHGNSEKSTLYIAPSKRLLHSKGPVIIEDNVWIGEKASIMPGVCIGKGAIIGANAVVTSDVPAFPLR